MKVLHYYWTQYDDTEKFGGGIRVYLKNIIDVQKEKYEVYMLNSGVDYNFKRNTYIKQNGYKKDIKQFSIVNSPMIAPSKCSFLKQDIYLTDKILYKTFVDFIKKYGPFDVIHFHSLEGLSLNVLKIKKILPKTKMILTLHNYYPFCPQVNLWKNDNKSCDNFHNGKDCISCMSYIPNSRLVKYSYIITYYLKMIHCDRYSEGLLKKIKNIYNKYKKYLSYKNKEKVVVFDLDNYYKAFRLENVEYINRYIDKVICVSNRVEQIATNMGINSDKCEVIYIGSDFARNQMQRVKYPMKNKVLNIIYMGYARRDKGFYFFIDALKKMPKELSRKIGITIAARFDDENILFVINKLKKKFNHINIYNGYSREQIKNITKNINLGIVPVLWEDNLPQIAMELKSMGIPILVSNRGGASELSLAKFFKFEAENVKNFNGKISYILDNPEILNEYYKEHVKLKTIEEHCDLLDKIYKN